MGEEALFSMGNVAVSSRTGRRGKPRMEELRPELRQQVRILVGGEGCSLSKAARVLHVSRFVVTRIARETGVAPAGMRQRRAAERAALVAGMHAQGASVTEIAGAVGVSSSHAGRLLGDLGLERTRRPVVRSRAVQAQLAPGQLRLDAVVDHADGEELASEARGLHSAAA